MTLGSTFLYGSGGENREIWTWRFVCNGILLAVSMAEFVNGVIYVVLRGLA
jgi:hypothetical protein